MSHFGKNGSREGWHKPTLPQVTAKRVAFSFCGAIHTLMPSGPIQYEKQIEKPPTDRLICELVAGPCKDPNFVLACGIVHVTYGQSLGLFNHLKTILVADMKDHPRVPAAFQSLLAEQAHPGPGPNRRGHP